MQGNGKLNLADARQMTPPVKGIETMRRQMALAMFDAVKEQDIIDVVSKLKEQALAGDKKAMSMFLKLMLPEGKAVPDQQPAAESVGLKMMAQAIQNLVDEIRIGKDAAKRRANPNLMLEDETDED